MLPVSAYLTGSLAWMQEFGFSAPVVLVAAYVLASLVFIPSLLLSIGAGERRDGLNWRRLRGKSRHIRLNLTLLPVGCRGC